MRTSDVIDVEHEGEARGRESNAESDAEVLMEGVIRKRGQVSGIWRSRWLVATRFEMRYYLNQRLASEERSSPRGRIDVSADFTLTAIGSDDSP